MTELNNHAPAILFVDDEANAVKYFHRAIGSMAPVLTAGSVEEGKIVLDANADRIAVLISDQRMPDAYGNELLLYARDRYPHMVRILTTAYSELEHTVEAVNQGQIHRYIQKPWEIAALRMELKQALEVAALRRDHADLLREKLQAGQKQTTANRIGALYALCTSLASPAKTLPVDAYLGAALTAGVTATEPNWLLMDYADLISSEAFRSAAFSDVVHGELARLESEHADSAPEMALDMLKEAFGGAFQAGPAGTGVFADGRHLTEYLATPTHAPVSKQHAAWLACLLWLSKRGRSLQLTHTDRGLECALANAAPSLTQSQLAAWVDRF